MVRRHAGGEGGGESEGCGRDQDAPANPSFCTSTSLAVTSAFAVEQVQPR
jgi:hypothetical protein